MEATLVYNLAMRNSCTHCDCKGIHNAIDVLVGDWYAEHTGEGFWGTSCIVACTKKGKSFLENNLVNLREFDYLKVLQKNDLISKSISKSHNRDIFFKRIHNICYWDKVEELYPRKYILKKFFVKIGLYDVLKRII